MHFIYIKIDYIITIILFIVLICLIFGLEFGCVQTEVQNTKTNIQHVYDTYNSTATTYNNFLDENHLQYPRLALKENYTLVDGKIIDQNLQNLINSYQNIFIGIQNNSTISYSFYQQVYQLIRLSSVIKQACVFIGQVIPVWSGIGYTQGTIYINGYRYIRLNGGESLGSLYRMQEYNRADTTIPDARNLQIRGNSNPYTLDDEQKEGGNTYTYDISDQMPEHEHIVRKGVAIKDESVNDKLVANGVQIKLNEDLVDGTISGYTIEQPTLDMYQTDAEHGIARQVQSADATNINLADTSIKKSTIATDVSDPHLSVYWFVCYDIVNDDQDWEH